MRVLLSVLFFALLAVPATAQPWYARGGFNGFSLDNPMVVDPGDATHYTANITGLFDNVSYDWKIAEEDYSPEMPGIGPGNDGRVTTDANGEINFHLYDQTTWSDGWSPNNVRRVGYEDHQQFDWEVIGSFNGFPDAPDPNFALMDMGNGLHTGTFALDAGIYDFKFRGLTGLPPAEGTTIGTTFNNNANNNSFAVASNGDQWTFELDLPNGRFRRFTNAAPVGQAGDYNDDGIADAADYTRWRDNLGAPAGTLPNDIDGGVIGQAQYNTWKANFGMSTAKTWIARNNPLTGQTQLADQVLVGLGGGQYEINMTGLTPQSDYEFKVVSSDVSASVPGTQLKVRANASGDIGLNFYELSSGSWGDGWSPANTHRVGYDDHEEFDWQLMGSFTSPAWTEDTAFNLTDQGSGLHTGAFTFATPGMYEFKMRQVGDWNTSIGADFGNNAPNNSFTVGAVDEIWHFELDLPNGRWRVYLDGAGSAAGVVPEPVSAMLALVGLVAVVMVRRRG